MNRIRRFTLLLVSLCLFFNVTFAGVLNLGFKSFSLKKSTAPQITNVKKTNYFVDFDVETISEEALQEETDNDNDNLLIDYPPLNPINYTLRFVFEPQLNLFRYSTSSNFCKLPLFILHHNYRL